MRLGFAGSRSGMTPEQVETCGLIVASAPRLTLAARGDMEGADAQFDRIVAAWRASDACRQTGALFIETPPIPRAACGGPPSLDGSPCRCVGGRCPPGTHEGVWFVLPRGVDLLVCAPAGYTHDRTSQTWKAIRTARIFRRPLLIAWPDGSADWEHDGLTAAACRAPASGSEGCACARGAHVDSYGVGPSEEPAPMGWILGSLRPDPRAHYGAVDYPRARGEMREAITHHFRRCGLRLLG